MDLSKVAAVANIDEDELFQLNPAFKQRTTCLLYTSPSPRDS